ncbi:Putative Mn2+ efflux pump MntP [Desulfonispora thiosulfatigenes DSM 11270]|uniref:Putative manganese efflux pump MntP n=1 Tax=Desulfonispora thiosulfatigenes DSM 11270 TaxID=656914 RepID=A0A1W1V4A0_DESTI|nr:manganese efflux pump [Desulfonispora thiosulfatigenes]SMB88168.1 Putative Mn2+ efflux pump MntP [Desulfonispora thiosulfatigenes DSM 11270]
MDLPAIFIVSIALGIDAFSLSLGIGLSGVKRKQVYLVSIVVAIFHIIMPLIGLYLGMTLGNFVGPIAGKIGALVLIFIGAQAIWKKWRSRNEAENNSIISINHPLGLILMAISVSLDALTVGFGLGTLRVDLTLTVIIMGAVAGIMTFMGLIFGKKLNHSFGEKAELVGSLILIIIGIRLLF